MRKSKKLIIGLALAAVLLLGSLGGIALANDGGDNPPPRAEFQEKLAGKLGITVEELQANMAEVREEMTQRYGEGRPGRGSAGNCGNLAYRLGIEVDEDAWQAAMAEARDRIQAGEDRQVVMAEVLESFGIDLEELRADCALNADGERPAKRGFMGHRGMGGMRGFGGQCAPVE